MSGLTEWPETGRWHRLRPVGAAPPFNPRPDLLPPTFPPYAEHARDDPFCWCRPDVARMLDDRFIIVHRGGGLDVGRDLAAAASWFQFKLLTDAELAQLAADSAKYMARGR